MIWITINNKLKIKKYKNIKKKEIYKVLLNSGKIKVL